MLSNNMQHQYWVTKKSVLRKLGGKEDECVVSSDAELDAKLELFKSINDSCVQLQRAIDLYQERLCFLAQEENALGRYLKECGKNEKNANAGQLMSTAGKALAYTGHQRLTVRPPLVRLHHEVDTFRGRAVTDTRATLSEMEKARTEYRAALSWMKSVSSQLDPDTGHGLERFRKAQSYVKTTKTKFDRYTLACLQKVDLLAAARCNMFSHALVSYQNALQLFATKASETLTIAATKLLKVEPYDFSVVTELANSPLHDKGKERRVKNEVEKDSSKSEDKDKNTFFNAEYSDKEGRRKSDMKKKDGDDLLTSKDENQESSNNETFSDLLGEDFSAPPIQATPTATPTDQSKPSSALLDLNWAGMSDLFGNSNFLPSSLLQEGSFNFSEEDSSKSELNKDGDGLGKDGSGKERDKGKDVRKNGKTESQVSWLSLFAELDPLANGVMENNVNGDRA